MACVGLLEGLICRSRCRIGMRGRGIGFFDFTDSTGRLWGADAVYMRKNVERVG